jgi:hypothetical protein
MSVPTWSDWPEVKAAQDADVKTEGPKYIGRWDTDYRNWIPEVYNTGIKWNHSVDPVYGDVDIEITLLDGPHLAQKLWKPVSEESTQWKPVPYPE